MTTPRRSGRSPVAAVRTRPETFHEDLRRAWRLAATASRGAHADPARPVVVTVAGATVHGTGAAIAPWTLEAVLAILRERGPTQAPLVLGDASALRAARQPGPARVLDASGATIEPLRADPTFEVEGVDLPWLRGLRGGSVKVDERLAGRVACVVAPLRRCRRLGVRGAVDAALAAVATDRERQARRIDPEAWAELLRLRLSLHPSIVFVLDATVCGVEDGRQRPLLFDLVIVGRDPVACDVIAARLSGLVPDQLPWLRRAAAQTGTPLQLSALDVRGESLDERALESAPAVLLVPRGASGGLDAVLDRVDPARWLRPWRQRRWSAVYDRTPWGQLHSAYRDSGGAPSSGIEQERS